LTVGSTVPDRDFTVAWAGFTVGLNETVIG